MVMVHVEGNARRGRAPADIAENVVDDLPMAVMILGRKHNIVRVNAAYRRLFDLDDKRLTGGNLFDVCGDAWRETQLGPLLKRASAGEDVTFDCAFGPDVRGVGGKTLQGQVRLLANDRRRGMLMLTLQDLSAREAVADLQANELSHRIRNSLHVIAAFVSSQQRIEGQAPAGYAAIHSRISAVATLYDVMSTAGRSGVVQGAAFFDALADGLRRSLLGDDDRIVIRVEAEPVALSPEQAGPIGLIVNELVTNAVKHAFPDRGGEIVVGLRTVGEALEVRVADNGVGMPATPLRRGLGSQCVAAFAAQLKGKVMQASDPGGSTFTLVAPMGGNSIGDRLQVTAAPDLSAAGAAGRLTSHSDRRERSLARTPPAQLRRGASPLLGEAVRRLW